MSAIRIDLPGIITIELIDWKPMFWSGIVDKLQYLLDSTLNQYQFTIDEYGLAHYFAFWLIDDKFLLDIGSCIGEMMFNKIVVQSHGF